VFSFFSFSIYNVSFLCCLFVKLGTGLSILISKSNPSLVTSFAFLSCGYLLSSYHEVCFNSFSLLLWKIFLINFHVTKLMSFYYQVRSVVLNTLNRARFTVAVDSFIKTGMSTLSFESSYQIFIQVLWKERCYCLLLLYLLWQRRNYYLWWKVVSNTPAIFVWRNWNKIHKYSEGPSDIRIILEFRSVWIQ